MSPCWFKVCSPSSNKTVTSSFFGKLFEGKAGVPALHLWNEWLSCFASAVQCTAPFAERKYFNSGFYMNTWVCNLSQIIGPLLTAVHLLFQISENTASLSELASARGHTALGKAWLCVWIKKKRTDRYRIRQECMRSSDLCQLGRDEVELGGIYLNSFFGDMRT